MMKAMLLSVLLVLAISCGGRTSLGTTGPDRIQDATEDTTPDVGRITSDETGRWDGPIPDDRDVRIADVRAYAKALANACGLGEAKRLLEAGLCPPEDASVISPGERIVLGGDPSIKSALPKGAQCPIGFEYLPKVAIYGEDCDFIPTCTWVLAERVPEPVVFDDQYLISGLDATYFVDPMWAYDVLVMNPTIGGEYLSWPYLLPWGPEIAFILSYDKPGCSYWADAWPSMTYCYSRLDSVPDSQSDCEQSTLTLCAAKNGPKVFLEDREVVTQYGSFAQYVLLQDFKGVKNCNILLRTYCCGPILMMEPEDINALREAPNLCHQSYEKPTYFIVTAASMSAAGLEDLPPIYDWLAAVRSETFSLQSMTSCAEAPTCPGCVGAVCLADPETTGYIERLGDTGEPPNCAVDIHDYSSSAKPEVWSHLTSQSLHQMIFAYRLENDEKGYPWLLWPISCRFYLDETGWFKTECEDLYSSMAPIPYRTPEEIAADIPKYIK